MSSQTVPAANSRVPLNGAPPLRTTSPPHVSDQDTSAGKLPPVTVTAEAADCDDGGSGGCANGGSGGMSSSGDGNGDEDGSGDVDGSTDGSGDGSCNNSGDGSTGGSGSGSGEGDVDAPNLAGGKGVGSRNPNER